MLTSSSTWLRERFGLDLNVVAIADRGGAAVSEEGIDLSKALYAKKKDGSVSALKDVGRPNISALEVLEEVDGSIVVEVTSTTLQTGEPGTTHIRRALSLGKHVVTTNKGSLAASFPYLTDLAKRFHVSLRFGGAVGGALPVLDFAERCLFPEEIESIRGVLNGTTNYVLWSMEERDIGKQRAIREAQELGYAEENVSYDVEGLDTARKLVILANWVMKHKASLKDIDIKGIRNITLQDVLAAKKDGSSIRLIGSINKEIKVRPERISKEHPLCVSSNLNAVAFNCTYSGRHVLIGPGAGGKETASATVRDIISIIQQSNVCKDPERALYQTSLRGIRHDASLGGIV